MAATRRDVIATGVMAVAVAPLAAEAQDMAIDLTATLPDGSPRDFTIARTGTGAAAAWAVRDDASVASGHVLVQTRDDPTDYRFPLAICQEFVAANLDASVRIKALSGRVDRAGGLVVRFRDPGNYYVVRANALEDNVNLYCVVKGIRREIHGASVRVESGLWHQLGLRVAGDSFTVSFDGKVLFTATDRTFVQAGTVGLWTKADSVTAFDALIVRALP